MSFPTVRSFIDGFLRLTVRRRVFLIVLLAVFLLLSPLLYREGVALYWKAKCSLKGGEVARGGLSAAPYCLYVYPDAGEPCHSSDECMGGCVLYEVIWGQPPPREGVCKTNNDPFECFATIEHPEFYGCAD